MKQGGQPTIGHIETVFENAQCIFNKEEVGISIKKIAKQISLDYQALNPLVMCIMNGGLVFCGELLLHLGFPLEIDYAHTSRYRAGTNPEDLQWLALPHTSLEDRHILLVDDILDEGHTLLSMIKACQKQGAASVKSSVLINKIHDRKVIPEFVADYVALEVEDHYVFGYGMDYKGYLRNAPGIYRVKE